MALGAMDEKGKPVDWWFIYKVAGKSTTSSGARGPKLGGNKVTGTEYLYFDSDVRDTGKLVLSGNTLDRGGALKNTLSQIHGKSEDKHLGWFFYNDENPINGKVNGDRGHTKGVLAFDLASNTAFWLIQSTPKFPSQGQYTFPKTGTGNAQTFLCITLQDADVAQAIARQMYVAQQPNVYLASGIPAGLAGAPNDPRVKLMQDQVASGNTPVHVVIPFKSRGGTKFMSIAKNKHWGLDFYNDLVGPTLHEDLDVETWEHDPVPPSKDSDKQHTVVDMKEVNLDALGIDLAWSEEDDHAKLAISARDEQKHYVCIGDLNFTIAQRKRGGGTVAFQCEALWKSIASILERGTTSRGAAAGKGATTEQTAPQHASPAEASRKPAAPAPAVPRKASPRKRVPEPASSTTRRAARRVVAKETTARKTRP